MLYIPMFVSDFEANLTKAGWNLGVGRADIMWEDPPTKPKCGPCCDCSALGVLKLTSPSGATGVKMELSLGDPYQYTFYLYSGVSTVNGEPICLCLAKIILKLFVKGWECPLWPA